jgi:hypothetical protein
VFHTIEIINYMLQVEAMHRIRESTKKTLFFNVKKNTKRQNVPKISVFFKGLVQSYKLGKSSTFI